MSDFIPGLGLSETFYREAARPIRDARFPGRAHSAALIKVELCRTLKA